MAACSRAARRTGRVVAAASNRHHHRGERGKIQVAAQEAYHDTGRACPPRNTAMPMSAEARLPAMMPSLAAAS